MTETESTSMMLGNATVTVSTTVTTVVTMTDTATDTTVVTVTVTWHRQVWMLKVGRLTVDLTDRVSWENHRKMVI